MNATKKWTCKDGREIDVCDMADDHLLNSYRMLRRKGFIGPSTLIFYLTCRLPDGDGAQDAFDREFDSVISAPVSRFVDLFKEELKRRGINIEGNER